MGISTARYCAVICAMTPDPLPRSFALQTPLHLASQFGWDKFVQRLLGNLDVNQQDVWNNTALDWAVMTDNSEVAKTLLAAGGQYSTFQALEVCAAVLAYSVLFVF